MPLVTRDVARLRRVLVCPPANGANIISRTDDDIVPMEEFDGDALIGEHAELTRTLRASGAEVLAVPDLLAAAVERARALGAWETGLRACPHCSTLPLERG